METIQGPAKHEGPCGARVLNRSRLDVNWLCLRRNLQTPLTSRLLRTCNSGNFAMSVPGDIQCNVEVEDCMGLMTGREADEKQKPDDSIRDLFIPDRWRSPTSFERVT